MSSDQPRDRLAKLVDAINASCLDDGSAYGSAAEIDGDGRLTIGHPCAAAWMDGEKLYDRLAEHFTAQHPLTRDQFIDRVIDCEEGATPRIEAAGAMYDELAKAPAEPSQDKLFAVCIEIPGINRDNWWATLSLHRTSEGAEAEREFQQESFSGSTYFIEEVWIDKADHCPACNSSFSYKIGSGEPDCWFCRDEERMAAYAEMSHDIENLTAEELAAKGWQTFGTVDEFMASLEDAPESTARTMNPAFVEALGDDFVWLDDSMSPEERHAFLSKYIVAGDAGKDGGDE